MLDVIKAENVMRDGCPALGRVKAFVVDEGIVATLEKTFLGKDGRPADLSSYTSDSLADGEVPPGVKLRIREESGVAGQCSRVFEVEGTLEDPTTGVVQAKIPAEVACDSGLYRADWAFCDKHGDIVAINSSIISVERSLFGSSAMDRTGTLGTPSLQEIRTQIMDTAGDNTLLDDVEFTDEQIFSAIMKPIADWDESLPPLSRRFTTRNFPWRDKWLDASIGYLYRYAAAHYRRNRFASSGGGKQIDDKNKEREYLAAAAMHLEEWDTWRTHKKISINARSFHGSTRGAY